MHVTAKYLVVLLDISYSVNVHSRSQKLTATFYRIFVTGRMAIWCLVGNKGLRLNYSVKGRIYIS